MTTTLTSNNIANTSNSANPLINKGIHTPARIAPVNGSPQMAAHQQTTDASNKLNNLHKVVKGGKKRRGGGVEVNTIKPIYKDTMTGNQSNLSQQTAQASMGNQTFVQSQGDKVTTLAIPKGGAKRRNTKKRKSKKSRKTKRRRSRKSVKK